MAHVSQKHGMTAKAYKEKYGYDPNKGIMSEDFKNKVLDRIYANYDEHSAMLREAGKKTRFKKGNKAQKRREEPKVVPTTKEIIKVLKESGKAPVAAEKEEKKELMDNYITSCCGVQAYRKGRADFRCQKCDQDVTLEMVLVYQALKEEVKLS